MRTGASHVPIASAPVLRAGPLDLHHLERERVIASYLIETADGPALCDCGPSTCVGALKQRLREHGLELRDLRHLLLSHIHLDHAGAAGCLVREHPQLRVHVSEIGAPHLVDPSRLEASARRLYGDTFDALWGELAPVPEANIEIARETVAGLACFATPGHASHHVCYLDNDGTLYAGDAAGVRIQPHRLVLPPTPPPEFDLDAWLTTIEEIGRRAPQRLALVHFGIVDDVAEHLAELRDRLDEWTELIDHVESADEFAAHVRRELDSDAIDAYDGAMPLWQSYAGLRRYAEKQRQRA